MDLYNLKCLQIIGYLCDIISYDTILISHLSNADRKKKSPKYIFILAIKKNSEDR